MASIEIKIGRRSQLDEFWFDGLLADTTYVRALVFDGLSPADAAARLDRLKMEKGECSTPESLRAALTTESRYTTGYRR